MYRPRTFGYVSHEFANVYDFRNVLAIFAASSGTSQSYIQMRSSDERTGENFENSHIQGSRALAYCSHNFRECSQFSQHGELKFLLSKHTLVGIISRTFGIFLQCLIFC